MSKELIEAGALRQLRHNDGSEGFVFAFDKATTDRYIAELKIEVERAKQDALDAARYRWWRGFFDSLDMDMPSIVCQARTADELDAAIDAQIAAEKESEK